MVGDWDDLAPAIGVGAEAAGVVVESSDIGEREATFLLRGETGGPGRLDAVLHEDGTITATASIGRFGDPEAERRLLAGMARRLEQLHGVDYAPRR